MVGNCSNILQKSRYQGLFNGIFVSSRYAQIIGEPYFPGLLNKTAGRSFVAAETAKYVVPLNQDTKQEFEKRLEEFGRGFGYEKLQGRFVSFSVNIISIRLCSTTCLPTSPR